MPKGENPNSRANLTPGGPGRKPGGRAQVVRLLDDLLVEKQEDVKKFFADEFNTDIGKFLKTWVMPLMPKDVNLLVSGDEEKPLTALLQIVPPDNGGNGNNGNGGNGK